MQRMISGIVAPLVLLGVLAAPSAHAYPSGPFCDPSRSDYNSKVCASSPQNDDECAEFGDLQACQQDYQDVMRWRHQLYPTPN